MIHKKYRHFNYARPSFPEGMARIFDFAGALDYYPRYSRVKKSGPEADAESIHECGEEIGQYFRDAIGEFKEEERDNLDAAHKSQLQNRTK